MENKPNEWVIDVTDWPDFCFCPYEPDTGSIVLGMMMIQQYCPGKLVGVYHALGDDFAATWARENPDWRTLFNEPLPRETNK